MPLAVVAGVGPGLGASIARRFAREGCQIGLIARSESYLRTLAGDLPTEAVVAPADLTDPDAIRSAFRAIRAELGPIDVLVHNASAAAWDGLLECSQEAFDRAYEVGVRGGFLAAREAVRDALGERAGVTRGRDRRDTELLGADGVVLFTGATTSVRGREGAVGFSAAKFGVRGLAESMARELGSEGIHVGHVVIDGGILPPEAEPDDPDRYLDPDDIADSYWQLASQPPSAWTLELDLRPYTEPF